MLSSSSPREVLLPESLSSKVAHWEESDLLDELERILTDATQTEGPISISIRRRVPGRSWKVWES